MGWTLEREQIADLAAGCALLGSGGGGATHAAVLALGIMIDRGLRTRVIAPGELADDATVVNVGYIGAPITAHEKLFTEREIVTGLEAARRALGRPIDALIACEIGGMNGMIPLIAGALTGLPVVDGDGMGRAYPRSDQVTFSIYGCSPNPTVLSGEHGEVAILETDDGARAERMARAVSSALGSKAFAVDYPLSGDQVKRLAVPDTVSIAIALGKAIRQAQAAHEDAFTALRRALSRHQADARLLFEGKVTAYACDVAGGWGSGRVSLLASDGSVMEIDFQNEFLMAWRDGAPVAMTPDILSLVDADSFATVPSDGVRYGQRLKVLGLTAPALMATPAALDRVGPRAFGYDLDYRPIGHGA